MVASDSPSAANLNGEQRTRYQDLLGRLRSPCEGTQSLARALAPAAPGCPRARYAARTLARRITDGTPDEEIVELHGKRWLENHVFRFALESAPFQGLPDAPMILVEFFDYGCYHCRLFSLMLDELLAEMPADLVVYYKHYPLSSHPESLPAAMAAVAAQRQGRFFEMHSKLFADQGKHSDDALYRYAEEVGLDMKKFRSDLQSEAVHEQVKRDRTEGESAGVEGTPTLYVNGRLYSDPLSFPDLVDWIEEELAIRSGVGETTGG
ncbi:MAG: thioredoxin domain-containing protein [Pseudomonadota bacterium]